MVERIGGTRPRPRVAILGGFENHVIERYKVIFPTLWELSRIDELPRKVDPRELDLLILASDASYNPMSYSYSRKIITSYFAQTHIISFSYKLSLPGPYDDNEAIANSMADTEQFQFPNLPLMFNRQREADFTGVNSIRGWHKITLDFENEPVRKGESQKQGEERSASVLAKLTESAIVLEYITKEPLATIYKRESGGVFVAWLPNPIFNQSAWVELLCMHWAETDCECFPNFGNWQIMPEWITPAEIALAEELDRLEACHREVNREFEVQLAELNQRQREAALSANQGRRRLVTSQGRELVEEVASVLQEFGFSVQIIDDELDPAQAKREDLRLTVLGDTEWEAIVEVRGYTRSSGQTNDFQRLARFATLYLKEKGREPDKRILVVNGEIDVLQPSRRQEPFVAAKEDLKVFSEDNGVVIWSLDLFRQAKRVREVSSDALRKSIMDAKGRWLGV